MHFYVNLERTHLNQADLVIFYLTLNLIFRCFIQNYAYNCSFYTYLGMNEIFKINLFLLHTQILDKCEGQVMAHR